MRRERVAAIDPFAPLPHSSSEPKPPANTAVATANTNQSQPQPSSLQPQQQQQQPTTGGLAAALSGFASTTSNYYYSNNNNNQNQQHQRQQINLLFDPFFKSSSKSHSYNLKVNPNKQQIKVEVVDAAAASSSSSKNQQQDPNQKITETIQNLFSQSEQQFVQLKQEETDQKIKNENEAKLLTPVEISRQWKDEVNVYEGVVSFTGKRKSSIGMIPKIKKEGGSDNVRVKSETATTTTTMTSNANEDAAQNNNENNTNEEIGHHHSQQDGDETSENRSGESTKNDTVFIPFSLDAIPEYEWWDRPFLAAPSYALGPVKTLPPLGTATAVKADDPNLNSFAIKKATAIIFSNNNNNVNNNSSSSSVSSNIVAVCALPKLVGWNPQETDETNEKLLEDASQAAMAIKTPEELKKERHAKRMAAVKERQEQEKAARADQHNFGLQRSIQVGGGSSSSVGGGGGGGGGGNTNDSTAATTTLNAIPTDRVKVRHLNNVLIKDVLLNPMIGKQVRDAQIERIQKHLESNQQRHIDAKDRQQDHEFEVDKRHALEYPRLIVVRALGITDSHTVQRFKIICKQDLLLRGLFVWIKKRFLVAVLVGGESAIRSAEQMFLDRFIGNERILREGTLIEVVWGCTLSEKSFSRSFLSDLSPFERDGRCKKPASWIKKELEKKQNPSLAMMIGGGGGGGADKSNNNNNNHQSQNEDREREYRRKFESISVLEVSTIFEAKDTFAKYNLEYVWDVVVRN